MHRAVLIVVLAGSGCATVPQNAGMVVTDDVPVHGEDSNYPCRKPGDRNFIGQPATAELGARMLAEARARTIRWVPHGGVITMDYSPSRLTVRLDPQNRIASINCG